MFTTVSNKSCDNYCCDASHDTNSVDSIDSINSIDGTNMPIDDSSFDSVGGCGGDDEVVQQMMLDLVMENYRRSEQQSPDRNDCIVSSDDRKRKHSDMDEAAIGSHAFSAFEPTPIRSDAMRVVDQVHPADTFGSKNYNGNSDPNNTTPLQTLMLDSACGTVAARDSRSDDSQAADGCEMRQFLQSLFSQSNASATSAAASPADIALSSSSSSRRTVNRVSIYNGDSNSDDVFKPFHSIEHLIPDMDDEGRIDTTAVVGRQSSLDVSFSVGMTRESASNVQQWSPQQRSIASAMPMSTSMLPASPAPHSAPSRPSSKIRRVSHALDIRCSDIDEHGRSATPPSTNMVSVMASNDQRQQKQRVYNQMHMKCSTVNDSSSNQPMSNISSSSSSSSSSSPSSASVASDLDASIASDLCPSLPSATTTAKFRRYQADQWECRYNELKQYRATYGHCLVDPNIDRRLSHWIKRQRCQYKLKHEGGHTTLTDERQAKLESLGFVWDSHEVAWECRYQDLLAYKEKTGHTNVPTIYDENPSLGIWVKGRRRQYRLHSAGQRSTLTARRIQRLEAVGFEWVSPNTGSRASTTR